MEIELGNFQFTNDITTKKSKEQKRKVKIRFFVAGAVVGDLGTSIFEGCLLGNAFLKDFRGTKCCVLIPEYTKCALECHGSAKSNLCGRAAGCRLWFYSRVMLGSRPSAHCSGRFMRFAGTLVCCILKHFLIFFAF